MAVEQVRQWMEEAVELAGTEGPPEIMVMMAEGAVPVISPGIPYASLLIKREILLL